MLRHSDKKYRDLTKCRHCSILFLTAPSNRGRNDLLCPFGCREIHQRHSANQRSRNHYLTDRGKKNKKIRNQQRYRKPTFQDKQQQKEQDKQQTYIFEETPSFLSHLKFVFELIEGKKVSGSGIQELLRYFFEKWRQRPLPIWTEMGKIPDI